MKKATAGERQKTIRVPLAVRTAEGALAPLWDRLNREIVSCQRCPRLRTHCLAVAAQKRASFRDQTYWGKPVPNLGDPDARLLLLGLAPAAHGANRTGRMFTGDRSGDFLFRAMYETGFASQPESVHAGDGLRLIDAAVTATAHCAPPDNKPLPDEIAACEGFLTRTLDAMPGLAERGGILVLGRIGFDAALSLFRRRGWLPAGLSPRPVFAHAAVYEWPGAPFLLCSYHPSQQNTFTGRLTQPMLQAIFRHARALIDRRATAAGVGANGKRP